MIFSIILAVTCSWIMWKMGYDLGHARGMRKGLEIRVTKLSINKQRGNNDVF